MKRKLYQKHLMLKLAGNRKLRRNRLGSRLSGLRATAATYPLLRELGQGLVKLLLAAVGLLLLYSGYLLSPHLRELLYNHFGRPAGNLERAWSWLQEKLPRAAGVELPPSTPPAAGGVEGEKLLEELQKNGLLLQQQQQQLERLGAEQERTADQLRWLSLKKGEGGEGWLSYMGKFLVGSGLSSFLGWLFGGKSKNPATREDLQEVVKNLAEQHTELDRRRNAAQLVDDAIQAQHARELTFIENIVRGILHQVNTFAAMQGLQIWVPDLNPGGGHFEDPQGGAGDAGNNPPPGPNGNGPPPQAQPPAPEEGPILEEAAAEAAAPNGAAVAEEGVPVVVNPPLEEVLLAEAVAVEAVAVAAVEAVEEVVEVAAQPEPVAVPAVAAAEQPVAAQNPDQSPNRDQLLEGVAAAAGVAVGVGVAAQLGAVAVPVAVPAVGGAVGGAVAAGGVAAVAMGAVPAVAVAGVAGVAAALGVRGVMGAGGWLLQRAFGPQPEKAPVAMREAEIPGRMQPPSAGGEGLQQRLQQRAEGRAAPAVVELAPEAQELLNRRAGLDQGRPNLVDEAMRRAEENAAREAAAQEAAQANFGQRIRDGAQGYWNRLWGRQPRSLGGPEAQAGSEEQRLGQRVEGLGPLWRQQQAVQNPQQLNQVRQVALENAEIVPVAAPAFNPQDPKAAEGAGKSLLESLANYSGLNSLKRSLDDLNEGVQKTFKTVNFLWEKKGWAGLALGSAYVGAPLLRVALHLARGRPDAAVGTLVRYEVARQEPGKVEIAVGEAWQTVTEAAADPLFMQAMQMAAGVVV